MFEALAAASTDFTSRAAICRECCNDDGPGAWVREARAGGHLRIT